MESQVVALQPKCAAVIFRLVNLFDFSEPKQLRERFRVEPIVFPRGPTDGITLVRITDRRSVTPLQYTDRPEGPAKAQETFLPGSASSRR